MSATGRSLTPSLSEARRLAREYDVVPLYAELIGDLETPISAALKFADEENVFLLESAEEAELFGRYSFLGFDPKRTLSYRDGLYTVVDADGVREVPGKDPFRGLAEIVGQKSVAPLPNLPAFVGGAVGYFSYDAVRYLERLPDAPPDDLQVPEAYFAITDALVVFDHLRHKVLVISLVDAARLRNVEGEGVHPGRGRVPDRALPEVQNGDSGPRPTPPLQGSAHGLSLSLHDVPEARGSLPRGGLARPAGARRGPQGDDPSHRGHAPPRGDARGGRCPHRRTPRRREGA